MFVGAKILGLMGPVFLLLLLKVWSMGQQHRHHLGWAKVQT